MSKTKIVTSLFCVALLFSSSSVFAGEGASKDVHIQVNSLMNGVPQGPSSGVVKPGYVYMLSAPLTSFDRNATPEERLKAPVSYTCTVVPTAIEGGFLITGTLVVFDQNGKFKEQRMLHKRVKKDGVYTLSFEGGGRKYQLDIKPS